MHISLQKPGRSRRGSSRPARGKLRRFLDIENVIVEEPFQLFKPSAGGGGSEEDRKAGDGCYVSATVQNRRYYGLLVDQEALKHSSLLWFQEEAGSLDLNRRMKKLHSEADTNTGIDDKKRPATSHHDSSEAGTATKRIKLENGQAGATMPDSIASSAGSSTKKSEAKQPATPGHQRQVQKFRYARPLDKNNDKDLGYRYLLATFADVDAASEDDSEKATKIEEACQAGGGYVGKYYYQYEVRESKVHV